MFLAAIVQSEIVKYVNQDVSYHLNDRIGGIHRR